MLENVSLVLLSIGSILLNIVVISISFRVSKMEKRLDLIEFITLRSESDESKNGQ